MSRSIRNCLAFTIYLFFEDCTMSLCRAHVNKQVDQPRPPCTTPLHKCPKAMLPQFALRVIDSTNRYAAMYSSMAL